MEKHANLHRDTDGSSLCATIPGDMGDGAAVGGVKGAAEKRSDSEAALGTLVNVSCNNGGVNVGAPGNVSSGTGRSGVPEVQEGEKKKDAEPSGSWSGDRISNGMGHESVLAAGDSEGGASKLVNNTPGGPCLSPGEQSAAVPPEGSARGESEPTKLAKPTHLCPESELPDDRASSEKPPPPSGSDPDPSPGGESRSLDSLESFSNLNSCPSSDPNSEGLEDRGLALALQSEYGADGTKTACTKDRAAGQSIYHIKWIKWREENTPIITQNENGPCPLLAIMNVLLLAWKVKPVR